MKTVFIFGAGASYDAGAPLMADFLDRAHDLYWRGNERVVQAATAFQNVFKAQSDLQSLFSKAYLNINNLESLFSAVDIAQVIQKFGSRTPEEIPDLRTDLVTVIYKTLEQTVRFPMVQGRVESPRPYGRFVSTMRDLMEEAPFRGNSSFSFITFNYDVALDYALTKTGMRFNYELPDSVTYDLSNNPVGRPSSVGLSLMKLHGSMNWLESPDGERVHLLTFDKVARGQGFHDESGETPILTATNIIDKPASEYYGWRPLIVPPTWNKTGQHPYLASIWRAAARALECADNIIIIGYSLPETDLFFRFLFALGVDSATRVRRFWVFDPNPAVGDRFRDLVGSAIRDRFQFRPIGFKQAIPLIASSLKANKWELPEIKVEPVKN